MKWPSIVSMGIATALSGCVFEALDTDNLSCPCASGFVCVADQCVPSSLDIDAGTLDAGQNMALPEAGMTPDAGFITSTDAGIVPDAGALASDCTQIESSILCDGFEAIGVWDTFPAQGGRVELSEEQARLGRRSLKVTIDEPGGFALAEAQNRGPFTSGSLFLREWVYLPSEYVISNASLMYLNESTFPFTTASINIVESNRYSISFINSDGVSEFNSIQTDIGRDRWVCLEMEVSIGETGAVILYVDEQPLVEINDINTQAVWDKLGGGTNFTSDSQGSLIYYVDDFVMTSTRTPCTVP